MPVRSTKRAKRIKKSSSAGEHRFFSQLTERPFAKRLFDEASEFEKFAGEHSLREEIEYRLLRCKLIWVRRVEFCDKVSQHPARGLVTPALRSGFPSPVGRLSTDYRGDFILSVRLCGLTKIGASCNVRRKGRYFRKITSIKPGGEFFDHCFIKITKEPFGVFAIEDAESNSPKMKHGFPWLAHR